MLLTMISRSDMILLTILMLLLALFAGSINSELTKTFSDPEWIDVDQWEL